MAEAQSTFTTMLSPQQDSTANEPHQQAHEHSVPTSNDTHASGNTDYSGKAPILKVEEKVDHVKDKALHPDRRYRGKYGDWMPSANDYEDPTDSEGNYCVGPLKATNTDNETRETPVGYHKNSYHNPSLLEKVGDKMKDLKGKVFGAKTSYGTNTETMKNTGGNFTENNPTESPGEGSKAKQIGTKTKHAAKKVLGLRPEDPGLTDADVTPIKDAQSTEGMKGKVQAHIP